MPTWSEGRTGVGVSEIHKKDSCVSGVAVLLPVKTRGIANLKACLTEDCSTSNQDFQRRNCTDSPYTICLLLSFYFFALWLEILRY